MNLFHFLFFHTRYVGRQRNFMILFKHIERTASNGLMLITVGGLVKLLVNVSTDIRLNTLQNAGKISNLKCSEVTLT